MRHARVRIAALCAGARSRPVACAMLRVRSMKPVLLLAFLALGPALADQFPLTGLASAPANDPGAVAAGSPSDAVPGATPLQGERAWLCRR